MVHAPHPLRIAISALTRASIAVTLALAFAAPALAADADGDGIVDESDNCLEVPNQDQTDSDDDQFGNACDADLNDDGVVNFGDLAILKQEFFGTDPDADLNGDGLVNFGDLARMRNAFFQPPGPSGLLPAVLPAFEVVKAGLDAEEAKALSDAFGVEAVHAEDGSLQFVSDRLGDVPMMDANSPAVQAAAVVLPRDEDGQDTVARAFDVEAIRKLEPVDERTARALTRNAFAQAGVPLPGEAGESELHVSHTMLRLFSLDGGTDFSHPIDTSVRFDFRLSGRPLVGPGARVRLVLAPSGAPTQLLHAMRELKSAAEVRLEDPFTARDTCARSYPPGSRLKTPRLVYWAPSLERSVQRILPHWECRGTDPNGATLVPALLPAVQEGAPVVTVQAGVQQGAQVEASARVTGGTPPYFYSWHSLTTDLPDDEAGKAAISYLVQPRAPVEEEVLFLTVTDSNGLAGKAGVTLKVATQRALAAGGDLVTPQSVGRLDVGGEFNVYEWNCVKQSSSGFRSAFVDRGIPVQFRWNGNAAWERDFRESSAPQSGNDASYVDDVDLAWYTGHGSPGSFTFDNPNHDDGSIVPDDARWGDRDLEWMQLESCNVLQFTSGGKPIWDRWARVFDRLHLLNGFQTTASCVDVTNGTAGRFSRYLFPRQIFFVQLPPLKVRQAWAQMAQDLEPAGRQYVTMGAAGPGWITNYDDYFWGQGPVGPDIPRTQIVGYWWLMGEV